jgi:Glutathione S-transferase
MLKFYFNGAPNPNKVALFLEESGLPYELVPVDTRKGDQFKPEFLKVNPNGKVPAIDDDGVFVFDSNAILLYLAEKTGKFLPPNTPDNRAQLLSWLMFVASGVGSAPALFGPGGAFQALRAERPGICPQPLPVRSPTPLRHSRRSPRQQPLHGRRYLHHRRHGVVGLGPAGAVRARR